ncbi:MAG TPA: MBL fold metallo-hydrolase [Nocardioidaceae bacterium]|nr:MBL fold metallo-hydrolase [Nocardioidaceae bacterium]
MSLTKFGHACVRIEYDGQVLVIDPGSWSEPESVQGATAVLVTHEHADHLSFDNLRATDAPVFTIEAVAAQIAAGAKDVAERVTVVAPGDEFDAGLAVRAVGELHAVIHPELPRFHNSGYVVRAGDTAVYHPGDAFTLPQQDVDLLLAPVHAPWSKVSEVMDFVCAVGAPRTVAIHDGLLNDRGLALVEQHVGRVLGERDLEYARVEPGTELRL